MNKEDLERVQVIKELFYQKPPYGYGRWLYNFKDDNPNIWRDEEYLRPVGCRPIGFGSVFHPQAGEWFGSVFHPQGELKKNQI